MIVKYLRVSTTKQNIGRQDIKLDKLGIKFDKKYVDKITEKIKERPMLNKMIVELAECKATGQTKTGRWFGKEEKQTHDPPKDFKKYYIKMINKAITKVEMAKLLGVGRATLYRWIKLYTNNQNI